MTEPNNQKKGMLISFEGSEGSGKTTQVSRMATFCEDAGYDVIVTREPGGTEIGEEIRHLLMHASSGSKMHPETELLLFADDGDENAEGLINSVYIVDEALSSSALAALGGPSAAGIPEPATLALFGLGGLTMLRRRTPPMSAD